MVAVLRRTVSVVILVLASAMALASSPRQPAGSASLGAAQNVARGVDLYRITDRALVDDAGPVSIVLLRVDPAAADVRLVRAAEQKPRREVVTGIAKRTNALAAINAGFFVLETGGPAGLLKVDGKLASCPANPRAALGIEHGPGRRSAEREGGGAKPGLRLLIDRVGCAKKQLTPLNTDARRWSRVRDIVGGAGLLKIAGRDVDDWAVEKMRAGFDTERHPRTAIGAAADGAIWLIAVDGRQPAHSVGMTMKDLVRLSNRIGLRDALNLDGGGSTTMVVKGEIVNKPSDAAGPRAVSDALVVLQK